MLLDDGEGARGHSAAHVDLDPHGDVVAGEMFTLAKGAVHPHRPVQQPHPESCSRHGQYEPEADRIEGRRPEGPRRKVDSAAEGEDPAAAVGQHSRRQRLDGNRRPFEDRPHEILRIEPGRAGLRREDQSMREHRRRDGLDVVRLDIVAAGDQGARLGDPEESDARARTRTQVERLSDRVCRSSATM